MRQVAAAALLAVLTGTAAADAPKKLTCDLSSEDAIAKTYTAATKKTLSTYGGTCLKRSTTFPAMAAVGEFASDRGCEWEGALHDCAWNDPKAAATEMAAAGWAKADVKKKTELALAWLREVDQINVEEPSVSQSGAKLVIMFWVTGPVGMTNKPPSRTHEMFTFEADGSHGAVMIHGH